MPSSDPEAFDWYQSYAGLQELLASSVPKDGRVLMAGCGNSRLSEEMAEDGYANIVNVDISGTVIDLMRERTSDVPQVSFEVMDMCELSYEDESIDAVVDKGTLDSLLCGENSDAQVKAMLDEVARTLKAGGVYFVVSYGWPETRLSYLQNEALPWAVDVHTVQKPEVATSKGGSGVHYVYVCRKGGAQEEG